MRPVIATASTERDDSGFRERVSGFWQMRAQWCLPYRALGLGLNFTLSSLPQETLSPELYTLNLLARATTVLQCHICDGLPDIQGEKILLEPM